MRLLFLLLIGATLLFNSRLTAQQRKSDFALSRLRFQKTLALSFEKKPVSLFVPSLHYNLFAPLPFEIKQSNYTPALSNSVHYTAFFCNMENRFHQRFNFWLKIRAGGDDGYRKMTENNVK
jgi:hypothetical protein